MFSIIPYSVPIPPTHTDPSLWQPELPFLSHIASSHSMSRSLLRFWGGQDSLTSQLQARFHWPAHVLYPSFSSSIYELNYSSVGFRSIQGFYLVGFLSPCTTPNLEDQGVSALSHRPVRHCQTCQEYKAPTSIALAVVRSHKPPRHDKAQHITKGPKEVTEKQVKYGRDQLANHVCIKEVSALQQCPL